MSQTSPEAASTLRSNYQSIFEGALKAYQRKTGKDLTEDPLLRMLETCSTPDDVLIKLREQIVMPGEPHGVSDKLTTWLIPTVKVIHAFTAIIGKAVCLVSLLTVEVISPTSLLIFILEAYRPEGVIFTAIGVLLSVSMSLKHLSSFPGYYDVIILGC
jgi:hypothetical protein